MKTLTRIPETDDYPGFARAVPLINDNFRRIGEAYDVTLELIDTGTVPGDGTGDTVRSACMKINRNFKHITEHLGWKLK